MKFGSPLSLSGAAYQQGQYDILLPPTAVGTIAAPGVQTFTCNSGINAYTAVAVNMNTQGAWWIQVINRSALGALGIPSASAGVPPLPTPLTVILPITAVTGDQLTVNVYYGGPPPMGGGNTSVLGLTAGMAQNFRADNRAMPGGYMSATFVGTGAISNAFLINGSASYRIMLKSLYTSTTAPSGSQVSVNTTIGGNAATLLRDTAPGFNTVREWDTGLLLDDNASVQYTITPAAAFMSINALFDYVPN